MQELGLSGAEGLLLHGTGGAMITYGGANNVQQSLVFREPVFEALVPKDFSSSYIIARLARGPSGLAGVRVYVGDLGPEVYRTYLPFREAGNLGSQLPDVQLLHRLSRPEDLA